MDGRQRSGPISGNVLKARSSNHSDHQHAVQFGCHIEDGFFLPESAGFFFFFSAKVRAVRKCHLAFSLKWELMYGFYGSLNVHNSGISCLPIRKFVGSIRTGVAARSNIHSHVWSGNSVDSLVTNISRSVEC